MTKLLLLMEEIWLTTLDLQNLVHLYIYLHTYIYICIQYNGINYLSAGAGFQPSTVITVSIWLVIPP